jgi:hypothetical protein
MHTKCKNNRMMAFLLRCVLRTLNISLDADGYNCFRFNCPYLHLGGTALSLLSVNIAFNGASLSRLADQHEREMNAENARSKWIRNKIKTIFFINNYNNQQIHTKFSRLRCICLLYARSAYVKFFTLYIQCTDND